MQGDAHGRCFPANSIMVPAQRHPRGACRDVTVGHDRKGSRTDVRRQTASPGAKASRRGAGRRHAFLLRRIDGRAKHWKKIRRYA